MVGNSSSSNQLPDHPCSAISNNNSSSSSSPVNKLAVVPCSAAPVPSLPKQERVPVRRGRTPSAGPSLVDSSNDNNNNSRRNRHKRAFSVNQHHSSSLRVVFSAQPISNNHRTASSASQRSRRQTAFSVTQLSNNLNRRYSARSHNPSLNTFKVLLRTPHHLGSVSRQILRTCRSNGRRGSSN